MSHIINKPTNPPQGYRMLVDGQDITSARDLIWILEEKNNSWTHRWASSVRQTPLGVCLCADTGMPYKEPKQVEDYCFFRCKNNE